jgi:hypothetical protein
MNVIGALGMVSILQSARQENGRYRDLACRPVLQNGGRHRRFFLLVQLGFSFSGGSEIVYGGWLQNRQRDVVLGIQIPSPCWGPLKKKKEKKTPKGKSNLIQANAIWLLATAVCVQLATRAHLQIKTNSPPFSPFLSTTYLPTYHLSFPICRPPLICPHHPDLRLRCSCSVTGSTDLSRLTRQSFTSFQHTLQRRLARVEV